MYHPDVGPEADLAELLVRLEDHLRSFGAPIVDHLRPGLRADEVRADLQPIGCEPTPEMLALWGWHDGTDTIAGSAYPDMGFMCLPGNQLCGKWHLMTVSEAVGEYRTCVAGSIEPFVHPPELVPVLHFLDTPVLLQSTGAGVVGRNGRVPVLVLDPHAGADEYATPYAPSLTAVIALLVEVFAAGVVVADNAGGPTFDPVELPEPLRSRTAGDPYV